MKNKVFIAVTDFFELILGIILNLPIPIYSSLVNGFIVNLPGTPYFFGVYLRGIYYKRKFKHLGKNVIIEENVKFVGPENMSIGDHTIIDKGALLIAGKPKKYKHKIIQGDNIEKEGELIIENNVVICGNVSLGATGGMTIGEYTGIGPGCTVYSYSHISMMPRASYEVTTHIGKYVALCANSTIICVTDIPDRSYIKPNTFMNGSFFNKNNESKENG